ncbi:MAG: LysR family transcriptional regulator [Leptolyngbyaceae cyanobacterium]
MEVAALQIFVEVMRQGSFAAVARDRTVDPSSVSRTIATLEQELGVRLFQRSTRRLSPTEAGLTYFNRVEPLIT